MKKEATSLAGLGALLLCALPVCAQTANQNTAQTTNQATNTAGQAVGTVGNTLGSTVNSVTGQLPGTVSAVGNTANGLVGGLQPTLQPVTQGVGGALNNLTQPDNISALLQFLSSVVPNHIEAHVNLDALQVEKLTVDVRGVDLRNLKVDLLVANSRNAGQVRPAMGPNAASPMNHMMGGRQNGGMHQMHHSNSTTDNGQPLTFSMPQSQNQAQAQNEQTQDQQTANR